MTNPTASGRGGDALVAVAVLAVATVWLGAALAAALAGHGALGAGLGDALAAAVRLPAHVADPATAWPPPTRHDLPGAGLYWPATLAVAVATWVPAGIAGRRWARRRVGTTARRPLGVDARPEFANRRDLAPLLVRHPEPGRFILGRFDRRLVATQTPTPGRRHRTGRRPRGDRGAVALVGPTRSGKTAAAIAGILSWPGPAILSSVKTDLWAPTAGWRGRLGACRVFDPTGYTGQPCAGWSPLRTAETATGALRAARALCDAAPRHHAEDDFWLAQAEILLSGLLWIARHHGATMDDVVAWVMTGDHPNDTGPGRVAPLVQAALDTCPPDQVGDAQRAARSVYSVWAADERTRSGVYSTAQTVTWPWADPGVAAAATRVPVDLDWLVAGPNTLYLCAPIGDQRRLVAAFGGILNDLIGQIYLRVAATGRPLDPPLLIVIDEAGNTPLRALPEYASTLAGLGVLLVTAWQSIAQIEASYGRHADTILTNHLTKVFFAGLSDLATLSYVARLLGDEEVTTRSETGDSVSLSTTRIGMVPPHALRQMRPGDALLVHATLPPAHLRPRPYYRVHQLRARARLQPTTATQAASADAQTA